MTPKATPRREKVERNIYRRLDSEGKARFELSYRDSDGRQRRQVVEGGIKAARAALADLKARQGRGERVAPKRGLTFEAAADAWWEAQAKALRPATQNAYGAGLAHLRRTWGRRRLDSLTVDDVARYVADQRVAGLKAWTVRGHLTVAGRIFEYAARRLDWAGANPVRQLDRSERPRSDQRERRVLTGDELARLLNAADGRYRLVFAFAAATGARLGECLGLAWRDLDLKVGTATFRCQLDRRGVRVELKTARAARTVELPSVLVSELAELRLEAPGTTGADGYVFCSRGGGPHDHRNVAGRALARAVKVAGLDAPAPTFHSLRHTHASAWIASGGDLAELSARLGHRDPAVTASVYTHEFERAARSDARRARLDALYGSTVAASERSGAQDGDLPAGGEVADLQAKRGGAQ